MKKRAILFSVIATIIIFGFANKKIKLSDNPCKVKNGYSNKKELSDIRININPLNGLVTEFGVPDNRNSNIQNLFYSVRGIYTRTNTQQIHINTITHEKLRKAKLIDDLIPDYPSNWIKDYNSVNIEVKNNQNITKTTTGNNVLSHEQKKLLQSTTTPSMIKISINYNKMNYNAQPETRQMNVSIAVVPEIEAEYQEGYDQMIRYLKDYSLDEIAAKKLSKLPEAALSFVVMEDGAISKVKVIETSGDTEIDQLLVQLIEKMPRWKPAQNGKNRAVEQEFVFSIGQDNC